MKSMTDAASSYFKRVAGEWESLRSEYFSEEVRQAAIAAAYLRPEMTVADVGAGTGFMTAVLAPLVSQVFVVDGSPEMLEVARKNLQSFPNLVFQPADGLSLPLPDASLDAVFANMYLHHCVDPLAAISEMVRVLRPGGRLVLTDLDAHPYEWLKQEMADVWLGFEREQVKVWLKEVGLVNRRVDCTGQSCCAESQNPTLSDSTGRSARISVFVATGTRPVRGTRQAVQASYAAQAQAAEGCGCGSAADASCCGGSEQALTVVEDEGMDPGYSQGEKDEVTPGVAGFSLGCGNPVALAKLQPGEVVLDIGSGGGMDSFLAARRVGRGGKVIGVDMTPAMIERSRRSAEKLGLPQVEFRLGQAEALPVADESIDVILSNCVINLCEDKGQVFAEAQRVLKPGGRLEVSDIVAAGALPLEQQANPDNWAGCVYGALPQQEYLDLIRLAGFGRVEVERRVPAGEAAGVPVYSLTVSAYKE